MPDTTPNFNHNQPIYTVSEVSSSIKRVVEERFGVVRIRGEISGWKVAASGHVYFRLKDDSAVMDSVSWRGTVSKFSFKPEDGLEVICTGKITTYPGKSSYQIVVESMEPAGVGALMAVLEKRRKALELEGLFSLDRKKPLPFLPRVIGVITSPTGAVIRDILHRIEERFPLHVIVWPVAVQGESAASQITAAISGFNAIPLGSPHRPDVLIVARGGGSIEDLWAFNEEIVVRAAAASVIPLISAVGHETDTTLIDYASDRRAPTPTAAAEMAVPVREELWVGIKQLDARLSSALHRLLNQFQDTIAGLARGLPKSQQLLQVAAQRLDDWSERLSASLPKSLERKEQQLALLAVHLRPQILFTDITKSQERLKELSERLLTSLPKNLERRKQELILLAAHLRPQILLADISKAQARLEELQTRMQQAWKRTIETIESTLQHAVSLLESVNYKKILERGFVLVKDANGKLVTSADQARKHASLSLTFKDAEIVVKQ